MKNVGIQLQNVGVPSPKNGVNKITAIAEQKLHLESKNSGGKSLGSYSKVRPTTLIQGLIKEIIEVRIPVVQTDKKNHTYGTELRFILKQSRKRLFFTKSDTLVVIHRGGRELQDTIQVVLVLCRGRIIFNMRLTRVRPPKK